MKLTPLVWNSSDRYIIAKKLQFFDLNGVGYDPSKAYEKVRDQIQKK